MDMHTADIKAALAKLGLTSADVARLNNMAPSTLRNVYIKHYPRAEKIIADLLGMTPEQIWPSRYGVKK